MIDVLVADDEEPLLDEIVAMLRLDPRIGAIHRATSGSAAIQVLSTARVDAVFLDIHMPGLSGLDLARAVSQFSKRPAIVFVTADEDRAVEAFDLEATDYVLKPVRQERLERAISRIISATADQGGAAVVDPFITVTLGSIVRRDRRSDVRYVQAQGDYARLHTDDASYLLRVSLTELEEQWAAAGFLRVHRSYLVAVASITSVRVGAQPMVSIAGTDVPVSRRLLPAVRDALSGQA
jgi:DNA-binding LytR/AlgR family response regulator